MSVLNKRRRKEFIVAMSIIVGIAVILSLVAVLGG